MLSVNELQGPNQNNALFKPAPKASEYINHLASKIEPAKFRKFLESICGGKWWSLKQLQTYGRQIPLNVYCFCVPVDGTPDVFFFNVNSDEQLLCEIQKAYESPT